MRATASRNPWMTTPRRTGSIDPPISSRRIAASREALNNLPLKLIGLLAPGFDLVTLRSTVP